MTTATLPLARRDQLPETIDYRDTGCPGGCDVGLVCPRPICVYDDPGWWARDEQAARAVRNRQIIRLRESGWTFARVAVALEVSERTVNRVMHEHRKRNKRPELEPSLMADSRSGLPPATRAT